MGKQKWIRPALAALGLAMSPLAAASSGNGYDCGAVSWIVPFSPGGTVDLVTRRLAESLTPELGGVPVVVENRPGASGAIGARLLAKAKPDGCTVMTMSSSLTVYQAMEGTKSFDLTRDFEPVGQLISSPYILAAHASLPANTLPELIALAKRKPDSLNYGTSGATTIQALAVDLLKQKAGIEMTAIAYKGGSETYVDPLSNRIQFIFTFITLAEPYVKKGQLKYLAVTSRQRMPSLPDVPAMTEQYPDFVVETTYGVLAPKGTPVDRIQRLNAAINKVMQQPALKQSIERDYMEVVTGTPQALGKVIAAEIARAKQMAAAAGR